MVKEILAHVRQDLYGNFIVHDLKDHLFGTADLASHFASQFGNADWAYLAGLWHDLGKYHPDFQRRIKTNSGYDAEAHLEGKVGKVDHSTAGAIHAVRRFGNLGRILAYTIAGHHAGLGDWQSAESGLGAIVQRLERKELLEGALQEQLPTEILEQGNPSSKPPKGLSFEHSSLWIRMLFSCLVDADFLDTEAFMDPQKRDSRRLDVNWEDLRQRLDSHLNNLQEKSDDTSVNRIRRTVLDRCRHASEWPPAIYSLTVPTGGGKTLSSMAFAMGHRQKWEKVRIIYVIPYTSIIEQTADIFRKVFGDAVVEHHSNFDPDDKRQSSASRLACENWDTPIVVTTAVQFFESLFASKTSRARKLHNVVNSVVVLDEAQLLPPDFLYPILQAVQQLHDAFGVTFLLTTATQPALQKRKVGIDQNFKGLTEVKEIIENREELHRSLKRVEIIVPKDIEKRMSWDEIAEEISAHEQVLCIVNRRDDCRDLYRKLCDDSSAVHLSALMCGEHRSKVIAEIKRRLKDDQPLRVISTQLVEAGVDIDFPVVYRALSGLDSIAQAAGRCNREGKRASGRVVIFIPPRPSPIGHLRQAESCGKQILLSSADDPLVPANFDNFFNQLYWMKGDKGLDSSGIIELLKSGPGLEINFRSAADKFHIIPENQRSVIVRYNSTSDEVISLMKEKKPERWLLRKIQRHIVNIPIGIHQKLISSGDIVEVHPGITIQASDNLYHPQMGFLASDPTYHEPEDMVV